MRPIDLIGECAYSYKNVHLTEDDFSNNGLTCVIGKNYDQDTANGSGKSNLLKIIFYAMFGKELNGESVDEISNRVFKRGHFVQFIFEDRGDIFKIQRFRDFRPSKDSILQGPTGSKAKLKGIRFFINDVPFGDKKPNGEPMSDTETQNIIASRIGFSPELFLTAVMTAQNPKHNFLLAPDAKKKDVVSELMDLAVYEGAYAQVKEEVTLKEKEISKTELQLEQIQKDQVQKREECKELEGRVKQFENERQAELKRIQGLFSQKEKIYVDLKGKAPTKGDVAKIQAELDAIAEKKAQVKVKMDQLVSEETQIIDEQIAECEKTAKPIENDVNKIQGEKGYLQTIVERDALDKSEFESALIELEAQIKVTELTDDSIEVQLASVMEQKNAAESELGKLTDKLNEISQALTSKTGQLIVLNKNAEQINNQLNKLGEDLANNEKDMFEYGISKEMVSTALDDKTGRSIEALKGRLTKVWSENHSLTSKISDLESSELCPTCQRPWDEKHLLQKEDQLSKLKEALKKNKEDLYFTKNLLLKAEISELEPQLNEISTLKSECDALESKKIGLEKIRAEVESTITSAQEKITSMNKGFELKSKHSELTARLNGMKEKADQLDALSAEQKELEIKLSSLRKVLDNLEKRKVKALEIAREKLRKLQDEEESLSKRSSTLQKELTEAHLSLERYKQWEKDLGQLMKEMKDLADQVSRVRGQKNSYGDILEKNKDRLEELEGRKTLLTGRIEKMEDDLKYLNFWKSGFGPTGIRSFICDEVVIQLNEIVREYLNDLFDGAISVVFESESVSQKGAVSNKISTKFYLNGKESPIGLLSGGEVQRIVLAVDLALSDIAENRTGTKINLKFMDEPFNGIDTNGQLKSIGLFAKIANRKQGFFIITHDQSFQSLCHNVIYVEKRNEISKIVRAA